MKLVGNSPLITPDVADRSVETSDDRGSSVGSLHAVVSSIPGETPVRDTAGLLRCRACLEIVPRDAAVCHSCDESLDGAIGSVPSGHPTIPDAGPGTRWFVLHWRPIVTLAVLLSLLLTGVTLRSLAPEPISPPPKAASRSPSVRPTCETSCWSGEACQLGQCVWQKPNDVSHLGYEPIVSGPFSLPKDVSDALPLDADRFAIALLVGTQIHRARTGEVVTLVSDAPQSQRLFHVGDAVYATSPQRIYVIDAQTTRLLKSIDLGSMPGELTFGAMGRRVLVSLPTPRAVAIIATEYHAEVDRIHFGDDVVGPLGIDDTGKRALTTTGQVPPLGWRDPAGGAAYAFDPSRLASAQDRVRASVVGNPVSVLMTPDGDASWVALRAENALQVLEWLPSGAVRLAGRIETCKQPEQVLLVRLGRRALVRCNEGRALEVFDLKDRRPLRHVPFNGRATDMAVSPDGLQVVVSLQGDGGGAVALVDLETYEVKLFSLGAEPSRVRLTPDGRAALVLSDRAKVAWVLR